MLEAAILCRYELALRPETLRWNDWIEGQKRKVFGGLGILETDAWSSEFDIGQIGVDCVSAIWIIGSRNGSGVTRTQG